MTNLAQMRVDIIKKIDGFAKLVGGTVNVQSKVVYGHQFKVIIIDTATIIYKFILDDETFVITLFDKLTDLPIHKTRCKLYDQDSVTYDFETMIEILQVHQVI